LGRIFVENDEIGGLAIGNPSRASGLPELLGRNRGQGGEDLSCVQSRLDGPSDASRTAVLAQGAGAGMDSPFMSFFAKGLAGRGFQVVRFEFPYMAGYHKTGKNKPPDSQDVLKATWLQVLERVESKVLVIGGKSMGGRIAILIAYEAAVDRLICLGYPFHPVGKSNQLRVEHLREIKTPTLIMQGERDPSGNREEVGRYKLSSAVQVQWVPDGDHSFRPRKKSGRTELQNWETALGKIETFAKKFAVQ
jgi:predicted alpha/beta-hydrolase family hydrolase